MDHLNGVRSLVDWVWLLLSWLCQGVSAGGIIKYRPRHRLYCETYTRTCKLFTRAKMLILLAAGQDQTFMMTLFQVTELTLIPVSPWSSNPTFHQPQQHGTLLWKEEVLEVLEVLPMDSRPKFRHRNPPEEWEPSHHLTELRSHSTVCHWRTLSGEQWAKQWFCNIFAAILQDFYDETITEITESSVLD